MIDLLSFQGHPSAHSSAARMPTGMDQDDNGGPVALIADSGPDEDASAELYASSTVQQVNGSIKSEAKPTLLGAFQLHSSASVSRQSPHESTPGIASDINDRLIIDSTSEDDDGYDSLLDDASMRSEEDEKPIYGLPMSTLPTGLCYDDRMRYHAEVASTSELNLHPEDPRRIYYIFKELSEAGLVVDPKILRPLVRQPLVRIDAREATREECCLVHTPQHYAFVKATKGKVVLIILVRSLQLKFIDT